MNKINFIFLLFAFSIILFSCGNSSSSNNDVYESEQDIAFNCSLCNGSGYYSGYVCFRCNGGGVEYSVKGETNSSNVSFKGSSYYYGPCVSCDCPMYTHLPGHTECINCKMNKCTSNKFAHKKIY